MSAKRNETRRRESHTKTKAPLKPCRITQFSRFEDSCCFSSRLAHFRGQRSGTPHEMDVKWAALGSSHSRSRKLLKTTTQSARRIFEGKHALYIPKSSDSTSL